MLNFLFVNIDLLGYPSHDFSPSTLSQIDDRMAAHMLRRLLDNATQIVQISEFQKAQ
jgi:hypothetical protein